MMPMPSFEEVFAAAYPGRAAFPWQGRLVREILVGGWPSVLDLPTGVGKTTALDIALYCLAAAPEVMPRRTVLVVDRRIVVDQGAIHARELLDKITVASGGPLAALAVRLRDLWGASSGPPFRVAVMRGGVPRDNDWARRPDQPLLGVSTVDQLGSRLLFRGYGVGPRSASIHAGLVGNDTLILLDEVHLANAFAELLDKIHHRFRGVTTELPRRFIVTQMSATVRSARSSRVFQLDDADRADPTIHRRLVASKRAALRVVKVAGDDEPNKLEAVAARAVQDAIAQQAAGARVVAIVVNRVDTARIASRLLDRHRATTDALLITGRMRPIERDYLVEHALVPRAGARRIRTPECRPLIVVATQCIEAGADLDFDAMVTECASLDALRQRFGRVDRRGDLGASESVILCRSDQIAEGFEDPVYGEALGNTWRWLVARAASGAIDLGISALPAAGDDALLPPLGEVPVLLPAHLDAWAQTSQIPAADPDISLWLHGKAKPGADVQVVWRAGADVHGLDEPGVERLIQRLQACRPSALEAVTVPLAVVRRWLEDQPMVNAVADVEGEVMDEPRGGRSDTLRGRRVLRWRADESEVIWPGALRRGDIIVVDAAPGEMRRALLDPGSTEPVIDLGDLAQLRGRGLATLRLQREALAVWQLPAIMLDAIPAPSDDQDLEELERQIGAWLALWPEPVPAGFLGTQAEWEAARRALQSRSRRIIVAGGTLIVTARTGLPAETEDAVTEDDDSSFRTAEVTLAEHSASVRDLARQYARALGLGDELADDLALAAWFHDVGKADPRFQRWLVGGSEATRDPPLAKSALAPGSVRERRIARERAGYPKGYRHELLSLAMVQHHQTALEAAHDRDLVLHLVASHHGWCRPFPPPVADTEDLPVHLQHGADQLTSTTDHALARLDSGVAARFWRLVAQYGWWGLAWLEAIVRLADHRASQQAATGGAP